MVRNDLMVEFSLELDFEERIGWRWAAQDSFTLSLLQPTFIRHPSTMCQALYKILRTQHLGGGGRQAPLGGLNSTGGKNGNSRVWGGYSWPWKTIKKQDLSDSGENKMVWYERVGAELFLMWRPCSESSQPCNYRGLAKARAWGWTVRPMLGMFEKQSFQVGQEHMSTVRREERVRATESLWRRHDVLYIVKMLLQWFCGKGL